MSFVFKRAIRESVGLLIGLAGGTGAGKTFSAMRLAQGISGDRPFAVIDTEAGRAKHYSDRFVFDHGDLRPPFTPQAYAEAILAADEAGYPAIVVDSMTHEWAGEGGVLEMQEEELERMAGDNWQKREACRMAAWIKPKMQHKKMVQRLLQVRAHLILCFRAEEKVEMVKDEKTGKMVIVPKKSTTGLDGWMPVCEKNLPYELTASFLLTADAPGMPKAIKLQEQHRPMFPANKPVDEESGKRVAVWASGGAAPAKAAEKKPPAKEEPAKADPPVEQPVDPVSTEEFEKLVEALDVKTRPALVTAYNADIAVLKARKGTEQQFKTFVAWRDEMLSAIEEGTIK